MNIITVDQDTASIAGAVVFWSLSGAVDAKEIAEELTRAGFSEEWHPAPPTEETALRRAAQANCKGSREFVRPLGKRGQFTLVEEHVVSAEGEPTKLELEHKLYIGVERDGEAEVTTIRGTSEKYSELMQAVKHDKELQLGLLAASDISTWLLEILRTRIQAVSLRDRGGFYFVPRDSIDQWRRLVAVLRTVSDHRMNEIPALRTDAAVEAILTALRNEANAKFSEMEAYLAGDVSTRGLNAIERELNELTAKLAKYATLLGVALPDLTTQAEQALGALQAVRMVAEGQKGAA